MTDQALSTLLREAKGPLAPPPVLGGQVQGVADATAAWSGVETTTHWRLNDQTQVDGIDFYVGADELGHIHLDGSIHLATTPELGAAPVVEGAWRTVPLGERLDDGEYRPAGRRRRGKSLST